MNSIHTDEHKKIAELLKSIRIELKISQKDVSNKLGISQSYLSKIESGQIRFDISLVRKFSDLYRKSISYFIKE